MAPGPRDFPWATEGRVDPVPGTGTIRVTTPGSQILRTFSKSWSRRLKDDSNFHTS
jgi:hypothetical protein